MKPLFIHLACLALVVCAVVVGIAVATCGSVSDFINDLNKEKA